MGFGKYLLGGVCAVGAVIAAPVVLPTAGIMAAPMLVNAVVPAGIAAGKVYEKKMNEARKDGYVAASQEYEEKLRQQAEEFMREKGKWEIKKDEYEGLLNEYETYIKELEEKNENRAKVLRIREEYDALLSLQWCP